MAFGKFEAIAVNPVGSCDYLGQDTQMGLELNGSDPGYNPPLHSTNGIHTYTNNMWQENTGTYHYQDEYGLGPVFVGAAHITPYWFVYPWNNSTGGIIWNSCDC